MNRRIIELLKNLEREICNPRTCKAVDYNDCSICNIHRMINSILDELNGS